MVTGDVRGQGLVALPGAGGGEASKKKAKSKPAPLEAKGAAPGRDSPRKHVPRKGVTM